MVEEYLNLDDVKNRLGNPSNVRKRPITIQAYQITQDDFLVHSNEGIVKGKKGDWLMVGVNGEIYICSNEVFTKTYQLV